MKILHIHNHYRITGGEDVMFDAIVQLLRDSGDDVVLYERDSKVMRGFGSKVKAAMTGIYSVSARREVEALLANTDPDVVHVHNVYPLISASVISTCYRKGYPVVLACPDYRFICPTSCCYNHEGPCERCKAGAEYWCVVKNCRGSYPESIAYAARATTARVLGMYRDHVDCFVPPSEFVSKRLLEAGFPANKVRVIPNMVTIPQSCPANGAGDYVGYAGRLTAEKGVGVLLESAVKTKLPLRLAGAFVNDMKWSEYESNEIRFLGPLPRHDLREFYSNARFVVAPSVCQEAFGLVAAEAMAHGRPVIAARVGGLQEVIQDGVTGYLVTPGDSEELAERMTHLWERPELCREMGAAARQRSIDLFSREAYYPRLKRAYDAAAVRAQERRRN